MQPRTATLDDIAGLAELAATTFPLACPPELTDADIALAVREFFTLENVTSWVNDPHSIVLVVEQDDQLVGYALADLSDAQALLSKCYVRQGHHGSGISAALMNEIIDRARSSGVTVMTLGTNQENLRALRFYEKHGFERSGTRTFQVGGTTCQDYVLSRSL
ncbi:MAG: GNAT family N-acetyltransferase [Canibacter sp.]